MSTHSRHESDRPNVKISQKNTLLKIILSAVTVCLMISLAFNFYFQTTYTAENVISLQNKVNSLQGTVSNQQTTIEKDSTTISSLSTQVTNLQQTLNSQQNTISQQNNQISIQNQNITNLKDKLQYATVTLSGSANTTPGNPTVAVEFTSGGIVTKAAVINNRYITMLANYRNYTIVIDYNFLAIGGSNCTPKNHTLSLDLQTTNAIVNYSC